MERLLADAEKLTGVHYDIDNLGDVYAAIHAIQGDLGLTGVAAAEASETFSGSFNAMKASAQNLLGSLALGQNVSPAMEQLASSVSTFFFGNLIPMIGTLIKSLPKAIVAFLKSGLPMLVKGIASLLKSLTDSIVKFADGTTGKGVSKWAKANVPKILKAGGQLMMTLVKAIVTNIPKIVLAVGKIALAILEGLGSALWNKLKAIFVAGWNAIISVIQNALNSIKTTISNAWNSIKITATTAWNSIKTAITTPFNNAKTTLTNIVSSIKSTVSSGFSGISSTVRSAFNKVKDAITSPIQSAKSTLSGIISKIKGMFPLNLGKVFNLKLPHFKITSYGKFPWGVGGKGSAPSWDVSWYAKGGIVDGATVFGGIGMGENGAEAILPLDPFWKRLDQMADANGTNIVININGANKDPREIADEVKRALIRETNQRRLAWQ